jgi:two-component sensor histidine kinase
MAVLRGPDHVFELTNNAYKRLVGDRDFIGRPLRDVIPEIKGQGFFELLDEVYQTGETHVGRRVPLRALADVDGPLRDMYVDFVYQPIIEANGKVSAIFVEGVDVTDHVRAEEHLRLMNEELKHRGKNTLAVVSAIASQTFRGAAVSTAMAAFRGRVNAFAQAHDALTAANWTAASVSDVVHGALTPHKTEEERFSISGPQIMFGPKQALSLALTIHELATNAVKYGALSNDQGHVAITWDESSDGETPTFHFSWQEQDGPAVAKPAKLGFGTRLIESVLANDLKGRVEVSYDPSGLKCRIDAPMENLASGIFVSPIH